MVKVVPFISQPRISFACCQRPSSLSSLASEIVSPPFWSVSVVGGKIVWMPCSIARDSCRIWSCAMLSVHTMKSSTKTSRRVIVVVRSCKGKFPKSVGSIFVSSLCGGKVTWRSDWITSHAVSEAAQKNGGDSHQPI